MVLRGGGGKPNYDSVNVQIAEQALAKANLPQNIMIDCSHENSSKKPCAATFSDGQRHQPNPRRQPPIVGLMVESNIKHGRQNIPANLDDLEYGLSVTDGCISFEETEEAILKCTKN